MATQYEADQALAQHEHMLLGNDNVIYAAVVSDHGEWLIEVGVHRFTETMPPEALSLADPVATGADEERSRIKIRVVQAEPPHLTYRDRVRPLTGGNSLGNEDVEGIGTLGCIIGLRNYPDRLFGLTCHHVLFTTGKVGDAVVQPAIADSGSIANDRIGAITWGKVDQVVDVAIVEVNKDESSLMTMHGANNTTYKIKGIGNAIEWTRVWKVGRSTNSTSGIVKSVNASVNIDGQSYSSQLMVDQIMVEGGDSGSIVTDQNNIFVGLLFAGAPATRVIYANRSEYVMAALNSATF
ncbi:trypsin-like peptidase domain-containing protein [Rhizobium ruizarguesonis]|uniref:trypsin-like peptidase domain-containing protein n=1 Tax=Rhizobium ruizarguesonis TaxID=2081791 RepID=UPI0010304721|nr:trypsin-like peptidase domain-containing protein [Rhizobium ruizarguesonis]TAV14753.1 hypothetical protein ELI34_04395 [Rhizobium ruizarguesonis]